MESKHKITYRPVSELKELPGNPRIIKKEQFEKLKTSIKDNADYFEARPIILSDRTGELVVIAGNQRLKASKALGLKEVPTVLLEGLTEEREREIIIRDNVENGEWDMEILANEWDVEELNDWGGGRNQALQRNRRGRTRPDRRGGNLLCRWRHLQARQSSRLLRKFRGR